MPVFILFIQCLWRALKKWLTRNFLNFYFVKVEKLQGVSFQIKVHEQKKRGMLVGISTLKLLRCLRLKSYISLQDKQGYLLRMRLQRQLNKFHTGLLIFIIPCNYKLHSFFAKSFNKPFKDHIKSRWVILNLERLGGLNLCIDWGGGVPPSPLRE